MPYLKAILVNATDMFNRMLRAKAMECISFVGMAVGKEKFRDDAKQVSCILKFHFNTHTHTHMYVYRYIYLFICLIWYLFDCFCFYSRG